MELTDEMIRGIMDEHRRKPSESELHDAFRGLKGENNSRSIIRHYFVFDLMCDCKVIKSKLTANELFLDPSNIRTLYEKLSRFGFDAIKDIEKSYDGKDDYRFGCDMYSTLMACSRLCSHNAYAAGVPSDFPYERCRELIRKYNTNGIMYDPSCGWGSRLSAAIAEGVTYFGTDPNDKLIPRLGMMGNMMNKSLGTHSKFHLFCQGSETFIPELEGMCGLILTSPPYFNLEDYSHGEGQSLKKFPEYDAWLKGFLLPTLQNCYKYLTPDGNCIINVKNFGSVKLFDDMVRLADAAGFKVGASEPLKNLQRREDCSSDETCMVFIKKENPELKTGCGMNELF